MTNDKIHIGIDATALYGRFGGVEYSLWHMLDALRRGDHKNEYTVYVPHDGPLPPGALPENWHWKRLPFDGAHKLRRILWQQQQLPQQLKLDGCDLLHAPTYVCPLRAEIPVVLGVYDLIALTHPEFATRANRLHYRMILPRCLRLARQIIVPTLAVKRAVLHYAPDKKSQIHVVPLAVEEEFRREVSEVEKVKIRRKYRLPEEYLLFVGNQEPKKNLASLLRALRFVPEAPPLVIAGGVQPWRGYQPHSGARVFDLGYVARHELPALFAMCQVFVFPTLAEGFGLPVLEALTCGAPVVCGQAVPLPEIEKVALTCDASLPADLASQIRRVLRDENLRQNLGQRGREYSESFSWQKNAEMTLQVYRAAIGMENHQEVST